MRYFSLFLGYLFLNLILVTSAFGQTEDFRADNLPGTIPAKVREIDDARRMIAGLEIGPDGQTSVRILIDESGNVSEVERVTGPGNICPSVTRSDVLAAREAAAAAARMVKFEPAVAGGRAVPSSGWLYFMIGEASLGTAVTGETGQKYFDAADASKQSVAERPSGNVTKDRYTALGSSADYKGPVNTGERMVGLEERSKDNAVGGSPREIRGGILNGKARSLPKPTYPPAARAVRADGPVTIQVLIDEDGHVFSAEAISGHPLLRSASRLAACESKFSPTLLSGNPVKVSGVITYNFVAP